MALGLQLNLSSNSSALLTGAILINSSREVCPVISSVIASEAVFQNMFSIRGSREVHLPVVNWDAQCWLGFPPRVRLSNTQLSSASALAVLFNLKTLRKCNWLFPVTCLCTYTQLDSKTLILLLFLLSFRLYFHSLAYTA